MIPRYRFASKSFGLRASSAVKALMASSRRPAPISARPSREWAPWQRVAERHRALELGHGRAVVAALQVRHAHEEARLRGLAALEEAVDEGLAAQDLVAPEERVAQEVGVEAVVLERPPRGARSSTTPASWPSCERQSARTEDRAQIRRVLRHHALELRRRLGQAGRLVEGEGQVEADSGAAPAAARGLSGNSRSPPVAAELGVGGAEVGARLEAAGVLLERRLGSSRWRRGCRPPGATRRRGPGARPHRRPWARAARGRSRERREGGEHRGMTAILMAAATCGTAGRL